MGLNCRSKKYTPSLFSLFSFSIFAERVFEFYKFQDDYQKAYDYVYDWKYTFLDDLQSEGEATSFSSVTIAETGTVFQVSTWSNVAALTVPLTDSVTFGRSAFNSENELASTIGHELTHTVGILGSSECEAYTWEKDNTSSTGVDGMPDSSYIDFLNNKIDEECN